jgi:hypothetical protein
MTITMAPKQRKPISRSVDLLAPLDAAGKNGIIRITVGKQTDDYLVDRLPSNGPAETFNLERWDMSDAKKPPRYMACIWYGAHTCDCPGHGYTGGCKHVDAINALKRAGKL